MNGTSGRMFRLQGVNVAFHTPQGLQHVLKDISLDIAAGEWVALVGRNGSGKSTLAKVLAGRLPLSSGVLDISAEVRSQLVFQNPEAQLVGDTIGEDIAFGLENAAVERSSMPGRIAEAMKQAGLRMPLDRPVKELSGGQKQLLAAADCLALRPNVLIWDEATSMLDPHGRLRLLQTARKLHADGVTIIWVTQLMEELAAAQRVVALEDGRMVYEGDNRRFFYDALGGDGEAPCERIGFAAPYAVQVARRLLASGHRLSVKPIDASELSGAVTALCR
ncbi:ATP-binding cassette domain-containing protein [Paenibacillus chartarius]|uniref:ATP-binding cassette domain-containing protein n=1 Tax=Paenibacillus chartarius TaxID=747481 RepID=A0ABV6DFR4_9BACL